MGQPAALYPELAPALKKPTLLGYLAFFGPGAIIACVTIGSGETVFASRGGAIYGYTMLWCFVAGALCKGFQIYSASRFMTLTARSPLQSWMELPGPRGWFVWFVAIMTIVWMPFWLSGLPKMLGEFSNWVVGHPSPLDEKQFTLYGRYWGTLYIGVAILITWLQSYGFLEKLQTVIVGLLLFCLLLAAFVSGPDWLAIGSGLTVPRSPQYADWVVEKIPDLKGRSPWVEMMVYLGVIGGGAQDYFGYIGMLREKAWGLLGISGGPNDTGPPQIDVRPENIARGKHWLRAPQIDVAVSCAAILIFTVCFVVLGATVLHPRKVVPDGFKLLTEQAAFLVPLAGDSALLRWLVAWTYKTGIFFAFFGTILGAYEIYTRTIRESLVALFPQLVDVPIKVFRFWTLLFCGGGGLAILWLLEKDPVFIVTPAALVGSGLICGLWCFAMLWSDRVHLPPALRMPLGLKIAVFLSGIVLTVAPTIGIIEFVSDLFAAR